MFIQPYFFIFFLNIFFFFFQNKSKFQEIGFSIDFIYGKCVFFFGFFCMFNFLSIIFWTLHFFVTRKSDSKNFLLLTVNVIYETLYSNFVNLFAKSITCTQLGNEFFNSQNLSISCSDYFFENWVLIFKFLLFFKNFFCFRSI